MLWFIAELCTAEGLDMYEIMQANIAKLVARYPEGFDVDRSINRHKIEEEENE